MMFRFRRRRSLPAAALAGVLLGPASLARSNAPPGRYEPTSDTVRDTRTQLTWQLDVPSETYTQLEAIDYCNDLELGGSSEWRLPSVSELLTLVDPTRQNPAIDPAFPDTPSKYFWTSSSYVGVSGYAWYVTFAFGSSYYYDTDKPYRVRCVR